MNNMIKGIVVIVISLLIAVYIIPICESTDINKKKLILYPSTNTPKIYCTDSIAKINFKYPFSDESGSWRSPFL